MDEEDDRVVRVRVRWREECVYERVVEVDAKELAEALEHDEMDGDLDELLTAAVIEQADYMADLDSCEDREILDHWKED